MTNETKTTKKASENIVISSKLTPKERWMVNFIKDWEERHRKEKSKKA